MRRCLCILSLLLLLSACRPAGLKSAFAELDATIASLETYEQAFAAGCDSLRADLELADNDSLRFDAAKRLLDRYWHHSLDSVDRYLLLMEQYASDREQHDLVGFRKITTLNKRGCFPMALELFNQIDTTGMSKEEMVRYLSCADGLFRSEPGRDAEYEKYRSRYVTLDSLSYGGRRRTAKILRDNGDLDGALDILLECFDKPENAVHYSSIAYNIAIIYGLKGQRYDQEEWLARSAVYDIRVQYRDLLSLYDLARMLFEDGRKVRAHRYITTHYEIVADAGFFPRMQNSGKAEMMISSSYLKAVWSNLLWVCLGILMLVALLLLLWVSRNRLAAKERALRESQKALQEANAIKDNYLYRYMLLALQNLDKVDESRKEALKTIKNKGEAAAVKELRSPEKMYREYKDFYSVFDSTFLSLFPNFIASVNALLKPEARYDENSSTLCTELRILAAIRLDITSSSDIADFLKCSINTVYTYRVRMRKNALGNKDEFEEKVRRINL